MAWKINGIEISETSKVNGVTWVTGKKLNGIQLNICYTYDLNNNNPPFPPQPDIQFSYTDCFNNPQTISVPSAGSVQVCALVDSVQDPPGGSHSKGARCSS